MKFLYVLGKTKYLPFLGFILSTFSACQPAPESPDNAIDSQFDIANSPGITQSTLHLCPNEMECLYVKPGQHATGWIVSKRLTVGSDGLFVKAPLALCDTSTCEKSMLWEFDENANRLFLRSASNGTGNSQPVIVVEHDMAEHGAARMGIGVPSNHDVTHSLEVNGTILAAEIIVQADVADYVFDSEYKLMPLTDLEAFIQEHHHLPGITSESVAYFNDYRISIGESYQTLIEKIEELTLYTIEQERKISTLENMVIGLSVNSNARVGCKP